MESNESFKSLEPMAGPSHSAPHQGDDAYSANGKQANSGLSVRLANGKGRARSSSRVRDATDDEKSRQLSPQPGQNGKGALSSSPAPQGYSEQQANGAKPREWRSMHASGMPSPQPHAINEQQSPTLYTAQAATSRLDTAPYSAEQSAEVPARNRSSPLRRAAESDRLRLDSSASPSRSLLPPAPSLPYDLSYPPLSPSGVDQAGHSIAIKYAEKGSQQSSAARANQSKEPDRKSLGLPGPGGRQGALLPGHTPHERPKKVLPGEELEEHMVSETSDQHPMPWGLKTTLIEKSRNLPKGRTRMGTTKRNAPRSVRMQNGAHARVETPQPIKMEDELASESNSPALPAIEVFDTKHNHEGSSPSHDAKSETGGSTVMSVVATSPSAAAMYLDYNDGVDISERYIREQSSPSALRQKGSTLQAVASTRNAGEAGAADVDGAHDLHSAETAEMRHAHTLPTPSSSAFESPASTPAAKDSQRTPQKRSSTAASNDTGIEMSQDGTSMGDVSLDSAQGGNSRRPRAAHKRLKQLGGYYGKGAKPVVGEDAGDEVGTSTEPVGEDSQRSAPVSRASSMAIAMDADVQDGAQGIQSEGLVSTEALAGPSTPAKASQQPSLSMGLRDSASKRQPTKMLHAGTGADDGEGNNEFCETCNGVGHFICCDGCPRSFHFACINPPLDIDELPSTIGDQDDKWFCNACKAQMRPKSKSRPPKGTFGKLFQRLEDDNPTIFSLPQDVRNYFKGVATASDGSYVNSTMLRPLKINKFGLVDERDPLRLKDKNGKLVLCYRCGQSALPPSQDKQWQREGMARVDANILSETNRKGWRNLIGCDFCNLHWHLDCLDPPLASMPPLSRKWMCPNHVEHVLRPERVPKNAANSLSVHDLPVPSEKSMGPGKHYRTRVVNDGRIDIIPDPMDTYFGTSSSNASKDAEAATPAAAVAGSALNENRGRGLDRGWEEIEIPSTASGHVKGAVGAAANAPHIRFKYRLPEKVVRLDFWGKAELERQSRTERFIRALGEQVCAPLDLLATIANADHPPATATDAARRAAATAAAESGMPEDRARELIAQTFGSAAYFARPSVPRSWHLSDSKEQANGGEQNGVDAKISALRETFVEGDFEREFNEIEPAPPVRAPSRRQPKGGETTEATPNSAQAGRTQGYFTPGPKRSGSASSLTDIVSEHSPSHNEKGTVAEAAAAAEAGATATSGVAAAEAKAAEVLGMDLEEVAQLRALKRLVGYRGADALLDFVLRGNKERSSVAESSMRPR